MITGCRHQLAGIGLASNSLFLARLESNEARVRRSGCVVRYRDGMKVNRGWLRERSIRGRQRTVEQKHLLNNFFQRHLSYLSISFLLLQSQKSLTNTQLILQLLLTPPTFVQNAIHNIHLRCLPPCHHLRNSSRQSSRPSSQQRTRHRLRCQGPLPMGWTTREETKSSHAQRPHVRDRLHSRQTTLPPSPPQPTHPLHG